jgi:predicted acylesterase/phospholipase RssA
MEARTGGERWWEDREVLLNGIFKGGGAKGLMYAGAVEAIADRGYWFRAVAGSSAGAITAALIAAGLDVQRLREAVPEAMKGVRKMWLGDLVGSPLIRVGKLEKWLEDLLRQQAGVEDGAVVTFGRLYEATGIELYVVSVDVALRQPMVFSAMTTPELPVVPAVIASSAIPLAFRPGRLKRSFEDGKVRVHRLMDGGVWANYPAFVFKDPSFRAHHELPAVPPESITIGFTLDSGVPVDEGTPVGFADSSLSQSDDQGAALRGFLRFGLLRIYLMTVVPLIILLQAVYTFSHGGLTVFKDYATREGVPLAVTHVAAFFDGFFTHFTPALWTVVAVIAVVALGLAVIGATLIDSGVPAIRTLMAVGTDVPYWVGKTAGDHVVRLRVPSGLATTSFRLPAETVSQAVASAREQADPQLDEIFRSS